MNIVYELAGLAGGVFGMLAWAPQFVRTLLRKSARDISWGLLWLATGSLSCYAVHGLGKDLHFLFGGVALQLVFVVPIIVMKHRYDPRAALDGVVHPVYVARFKAFELTVVKVTV